MLALINKSGQMEDFQSKGDAKQCTVSMKRVGRSPHTETFTLQSAAELGLAGKDNWKKQPATMLKWRAIAACARVVFPDVLLGFYTPEEIAPDSHIDFETGELLNSDLTVDDNADQPYGGNGHEATNEFHRENQGDTSMPNLPADDMRLCDLDGAALYAIQRDGPGLIGIHPKHFEKRWQKRFGARSLKEIEQTFAEFMEVMQEPSSEEAGAA
jgi:hypothetical protein